MRIYNVEVTNHCNGKCGNYCPYSKMTRKKGNMSKKTFRKVLDKQELNFIEMHNFGEPLIHPRIFDFIKMAKDVGFKTEFSTNGLLLDAKTFDNLYHAGLDLLWVSIRPFFGKVRKTLIKHYDEYSKKMKITILYVEFKNKIKTLPRSWDVTYIEPHSWSGYVVIPFVKRNISCFNLSNQAVTVLWDGRVSNCCHDYDGKYIIGTIDDDNLKPSVNELCKRCEFYGTQ